MLAAGGELRWANRRALQVASQAVDRGATLTQHLLAFARRQRLAPAPVDLGVQVAGMASPLERTLGGAIRIRIDRDDAVPPALVDPLSTFAITSLVTLQKDRDALRQMAGRFGIETHREGQAIQYGDPAKLR